MLKNSLSFVFLLGEFFQCTQAQTPAINQTIKTNVQTRVSNGSSAGIAIGVIDAQGTHFYNNGVKSLATNEPQSQKPKGLAACFNKDL